MLANGLSVKVEPMQGKATSVSTQKKMSPNRPVKRNKKCDRLWEINRMKNYNIIISKYTKLLPVRGKSVHVVVQQTDISQVM